MPAPLLRCVEGRGGIECRVKSGRGWGEGGVRV